MAAPQSPRTPPTPSYAAGVAQKLRDSCHNCASSKVKCPREKPACSRCVKRNITCEYVATKRGGRRHDGPVGLNNNSNGTTATLNASDALSQLLPTISTWLASNPAAFGTVYLPTPSSVAPSPRATTSVGIPNLVPNLPSPLDSSLFAIPETRTDGLDDFFSSLFSSPIPDSSTADILSDTLVSSSSTVLNSTDSSTSDGTVTAIDPALGPILGDGLSQHTTPSNLRSPPPNTNGHPTRACDFQGPDSSAYSCLVRALGLMKQLFPLPSGACTTSGTPGGEEPGSLPTIQTALARNKETVKEVSAMLRCPCSQDGHVLAIMCHIVFKVLSWYAVVAGGRRSLRPASPGSNGDGDGDGNGNGNGIANLNGADDHRKREGWSVYDSGPLPSPSRLSSSSYTEKVRQLEGPAVIGSYYLDGEDSQRMIAQLVLSELHHVQRLVNQLSVKLTAQAAQTSNGGGDRAVPGAALQSGEAEAMVPFPGAILDLLATELRKRLKALSIQIVEGLRNG
ncbi:aflatoxin regulatory protein-domain-containing protein [Achaetomium macrosporum]|uniref:Aflatoxin regulatory protein-domain-containing protein n=1 Tax=Achaetomium macrosporum TaxID=79813 RepID=A0AAN7H7G7_9PEZI|nr:aflatoxin regulatory protein-domain-containing protein [Achaetomium macrosporum]